jgi:hypothetical protein
MTWLSAGAACSVDFSRPQPCDDAGVCREGFECLPNAAGLALCQECLKVELNETNCSNGRDDDCDGLRDCADDNCRDQACDDGNLCTVGDVCIAKKCEPGIPKQCNATGPCVADAGTCIPSTGLCNNPPLADGTRCAGLMDAAQVCCGGGCVNITTSLSNCGGCGTTCPGPDAGCVPLSLSGCAAEALSVGGRCVVPASLSCPIGQRREMMTGACYPGPPDAGVSCASNQNISSAQGCLPYCAY